MEEIKELKDIMKREKMSYEKIARELGVSYITILRWLKNKNKPSELASFRIKKFIDEHKNVQA